MKRAQASLPEDDSSHANKRLKMDPAAQEPAAQNEEGWTKVEKRKSKKQRKTESKQGVRVPSRSLGAHRAAFTSSYAGGFSQVHVCEERDPQAARRCGHQCASGGLFASYPC